MQALSITSDSIAPNNNLSMDLFPIIDTSIKPAAMTKATVISWVAALDALLGFWLPRYWDTTTAPPVATAANILISRLFIISTRETPDIAASPAYEIMTVSTMPTVMARICSMISG